MEVFALLAFAVLFFALNFLSEVWSQAEQAVQKVAELEGTQRAREVELAFIRGQIDVLKRLGSGRAVEPVAAEASNGTCDEIKTPKA